MLPQNVDIWAQNIDIWPQNIDIWPQNIDIWPQNINIPITMCTLCVCYLVSLMSIKLVYGRMKTQ